MRVQFFDILAAPQSPMRTILEAAFNSTEPVTNDSCAEGQIIYHGSTPATILPTGKFFPTTTNEAMLLFTKSYNDESVILYLGGPRKCTFPDICFTCWLCQRWYGILKTLRKSENAKARKVGKNFYSNMLRCFIEEIHDCAEVYSYLYLSCNLFYPLGK